MVDDLSRQSGMISYRTGLSRIEILLITSRETGRWVISKGNVNHGLAPMSVVECFETAGCLNYERAWLVFCVKVEAAIFLCRKRLA